VSAVCRCKNKSAGAGCRIHVLTSGNGLSYFQNRPGVESLTEMESFFYSDTGGGISGWSTLKSLASLARRARAKRNRLVRLLAELKPDVAVVDSEYVISPSGIGIFPSSPSTTPRWW